MHCHGLLQYKINYVLTLPKGYDERTGPHIPAHKIIFSEVL